MKYKLYIFDLDGTLIDTSYGIKKALFEFECRYGLAHFPPENVGVMIGPPINEGISKTHPELAGEHIINYCHKFDEFYNIYMNYDACAYPGILDLLDRIHQMGGIVAIDTAKLERQALSILEQTGVLAKIDYIEAWTEEKNNKPLLVDNLFKTTGISRKEAVLIGDSHFDGEAAMANDADLIAVTYGFEFKNDEDALPYKPVNVVGTVDKLTEIIEQYLK